MQKIYYFVALAAVGLIASTVVAPVQVSANGVGKTCGGIAGIRCPKGFWCDPAPGLCRGADISGKCVKVARICHYIYRPVCGCNGKTYGNDCARRRAKVQKKHDGRCKK